MSARPVVLCLTLAVLLLVASSACADVALGVMAGEPTGLSLKVWHEGQTAIDAASGWSFGKGGRLYVHSDYLWHRMIEDRRAGETVPFYFGIGGRLLVRDGEDARIGVRIPVGLDYFFDEGRFNVFVELAPIVDLVPETELAFSGGIGLRFRIGS
ncbi:MAG: hypothetical protein JXB46_05270 [Candidatus Eisenbacteria bacterium]|nr:hypothetical protein [Candidatus Eisenbacteria bacterium]